MERRDFSFLLFAILLYRRYGRITSGGMLFVFKGNDLLVSTALPIIPASPIRSDYRLYGNVQVAMTDDSAPDGFEYRDFRGLGGHLDEEQFAKASYAFQMWRWDESSRYCGRCGTANRFDAEEEAKLCPACSQRQYPAQFPVAIVAITRGEQILLALYGSVK